MKYLFLILCLFSASKLCADMPHELMPFPNAFIAEARQSSVTLGSFTSMTIPWISSYPAILCAVHISSYGSGDAKLDIFNGLSTTTANRLVDTINTGIVNPVDDKYFNIYASSAISIYNRGTVPAFVTITYISR